MPRSLAFGFCILSLNSSACGSRATREALVEATAATIMAIGAAALDAAAQEQAERDARQHQPVHVPNEPGTWRLVREYEATDDSAQATPGWVSARNSGSEGTTTPRPVISIGRCMVCQ